MKKSRLILILLLMLIILCTWSNSHKIVKTHLIALDKNTNIFPIVMPMKAIDFYLYKHNDFFELKGKISQQSEKEKISSTLGIDDGGDSSTVKNNLFQKNTKIINLRQQLIPLFYNNYLECSIQYRNKEIIVEGVVETQADKNVSSTLLANSTNNIIVRKKENRRINRRVQFKILGEQHV